MLVVCHVDMRKHALSCDRRDLYISKYGTVSSVYTTGQHHLFITYGFVGGKSSLEEDPREAWEEYLEGEVRRDLRGDLQSADVLSCDRSRLRLIPVILWR